MAVMYRSGCTTSVQRARVVQRMSAGVARVRFSDRVLLGACSARATLSAHYLRGSGTTFASRGLSETTQRPAGGERAMLDTCTRAPVAVASAGDRLSAGAARAAMRGRWTQVNPKEPGAIRTVLTSGVRVLVIELDAAAEAGLMMVQRLTRHWNPVPCVIVDASYGPQREIMARQAGACAYVTASASMEAIEELVSQVLSSRSSAVHAEPAGMGVAARGSSSDGGSKSVLHAPSGRRGA